MGTLTADCPRLDIHCPHKLATSCRLTSTPNCCACADERVHSRTYRVYIDGVGFVNRGTRWQGYCWFCKEFWSNRLAATDPPLEIAQTRIPEIPDQTEFLERWWEFHQGYRIAKLPDGTEQRIAVIGEPFYEVSPGFLPRTLDQLRAGVENNALRPENRLRRRRLSSEEERPEEPQRSLEDALDDLLREAEETPNVNAAVPTEPDSLVTPQIQEDPSEPPRPMTRREAQMQLARERFARVFGSREELEQDDYESPLTQMYTRAYDRHRQAEQRRAEGTEVAPQLETLSPQDRREIEEQLLWGVMRESQSISESLEPATEVWSYAPRRRGVDGEDAAVTEIRWLRNSGEIDVSAERMAYFENSGEEGTEAARRLVVAYRQSQAEDEARIRAIFANPNGESSSANPIVTGWWSQIRPQLSGIAGGTTQPLAEMHNIRLDFEQELARMRAARPPSPPLVSLDNQPDRPPPKSEEEMTKVLACQVCYQQLADIAVLPCGHMVMCQWCADVVVPVRHGHIPARPTKCPMCRKQVKQRFKIHVG
ncbi:hypothetical protein COCCADRAFT_34208 [Bipolaris zeicola 26-R-13]|uniref:RING-type domain-containing protein n=1 Tax=Cochliobolus carbonum (strain 26-R-13) TaxID=930089 RepID=W6YL12_COCC2|nr:uncharacterized protein COCCADRAFT_34208 [Bipolaris zeicola 26-R-13]EUC36359.1 hypothetical protein COCCADRAFT_34208 [Bipolaris zeicola 26-R-13]